MWEVEAPGGARGHLHVELQTNPDPQMGERLAEYALRLWRRDHKPLCSLVVYLRPPDPLPQPPFTIGDWSGREGLRFTYDVVRLWEVPPERVLETGHYELWPLAGPMGDVTPEATLRVADKIASAPLPAKWRKELTASLFLLTGIRVSKSALRRLVDWRRHILTDNDPWEASVLKDVLRDMATADAFRNVLEARFGKLDDDLLRFLDQAEAETLHLLFGAATESLDQIRTRLGLS